MNDIAMCVVHVMRQIKNTTEMINEYITERLCLSVCGI